MHLTNLENSPLYSSQVSENKTRTLQLNELTDFFQITSSYFYPKQLLSQQFWHPDQKKEFILEEYERRSQYYLPLIKEVGITCKEISHKQLYRLCLDVRFFPIPSIRYSIRYSPRDRGHMGIKLVTKHIIYRKFLGETEYRC